MQSDQFHLHGDIEQRHWWFVARRRIIHDLVQRIVPPQPATGQRPMIIDVGCGTGANIAALADQYHCLGIDTSDDAIRLARNRFPGVEFRQGYAPDDLQDCFGDASLIMLNDVLEHVPDDFELFSSLLAAAGPGTYFLMTVPADMRLWSVHDESFGHYRRYDAARFRRVWQGLPAQPLLLSYFNARLYPLIRAIRTLNRSRGKASGRVGTDFAMPAALTNRVLTSVFAGERHRLAGLLANGGECGGFRHGVSLITVLRRGEGVVAIRTKPEDVEADFFGPQQNSVPAPSLETADVDSCPANVGV